MNERLTAKDIAALKAGDVYYECEYGLNVKVRVIEEPVYVDGRYTWEAENVSDNAAIFYSWREENLYLLHLYKRPEYVSKKDGVWGYKLVGDDRFYDAASLDFQE